MKQFQVENSCSSDGEKKSRLGLIRRFNFPYNYDNLKDKNMRYFLLFFATLSNFTIYVMHFCRTIINQGVIDVKHVSMVPLLLFESLILIWKSTCHSLPHDVGTWKYFVVGGGTKFYINRKIGRNMWEICCSMKKICRKYTELYENYEEILCGRGGSTIDWGTWKNSELNPKYYRL